MDWFRSGYPIFSVILSGAQRSRRTCFLLFWQLGRENTNLSRPVSKNSAQLWQFHPAQNPLQARLHRLFSLAPRFVHRGHHQVFEHLHIRLVAA